MGLLFNKVIFIEKYSDIIEFASFINSFVMSITVFVNWVVISYLLYVFIPEVDDVDVEKSETFCIASVLYFPYIVYAIITIILLRGIPESYPYLKNDMLRTLKEYDLIKLLSSFASVIYYLSLIIYFGISKKICKLGWIKLFIVFALIFTFTTFLFPKILNTL